MPPPKFLLSHPPTQNLSRPHITLTWAQSLDSKIAGPNGARVTLSGPESMEMTNWMRTMHQAILVGINTIINDDPRLSIHLLLQSRQKEDLHPPQPIILDSQLRFPLTSRILSEWNSPDRTIALQPWVICGDGVDPRRREFAEKAGVRVIPVPLDANGRIPPSSLPEILSSLGISSVMIEGGSRVLSSFLHTPKRKDGSPLIDSIIVTVAPMFIGEGVGVVPDGEDIGLPNLRTLHTETMGKDAVMVCSLDLE